MAAHPSSLERRLWIAAGGLVAAIYLSLSLVRPLSDALRDRGLLRATMLTAFLVVAAAVALLSRRAAGGSRLAGREVAVLSAFAVVYVTILSTMERAEEAFHFVEYGLVGALIYGALLVRRRRLRSGDTASLRPAMRSALVALLATAVAGWIDEGIQKLLPSRVYDPRDLAFNALAGLLGIVVVSAWLAARRSEPGA